MFSSESSWASQRPYVGESRRMSTMMSTIVPRPQRTSLDAPAPIWKCIPRRTPRAEREWLSWMKSSAMPASARTFSRYVSAKKPRSSGKTRGMSSLAPGRVVSRSSMGPPRGEVGEQVVEEPRVDARRAEQLRLAPAAHADAVPDAGEPLELAQRVPDLPRRVHLEVVDAGLEAVRGRQGLAEHEVARGEVQADAVLEARGGLVVQIDRDVVLAHQLLEMVRADAEGHVQQVVLVLGVDEQRLAVRRRAAHEDPARVVARRAHVGVVAVGDRQRDRPPHGQDGVGRLGDQRVERDDPVEAAGVHLAQLPQTPLLVLVAGRATRDRLGQEADGRGAQPLEQPRRDDLGTEDDDDAGVEL